MHFYSDRFSEMEDFRLISVGKDNPILRDELTSIFKMGQMSYPHQIKGRFVN